MEEFKKILLRLKNELSVESDNQIAELLGITPAAFRTRKNRNSFPIHQLTEFVLAHPELDLDLDYILGNVRSSKEKKGLEIIVNPNAVEEFDDDLDLGELSPKEILLIKYYRKGSHRGKDNLLRIARMEAVLCNHSF